MGLICSCLHLVLALLSTFISTRPFLFLCRDIRRALHRSQKPKYLHIRSSVLQPPQHLPIHPSIHMIIPFRPTTLPSPFPQEHEAPTLKQSHRFYPLAALQPAKPPQPLLPEGSLPHNALYLPQLSSDFWSTYSYGVSYSGRGKMAGFC